MVDCCTAQFDFSLVVVDISLSSPLRLSGARDFESVFLSSFHEWGSIERIFLFDLPQPGRDLKEEAFEVTAARFVPTGLWVCTRTKDARGRYCVAFAARAYSVCSSRFVSLCLRPKRAIVMLARLLLVLLQSADAEKMARRMALVERVVPSTLLPSLQLPQPPPLPPLLPPPPLPPQLRLQLSLASAIAACISMDCIHARICPLPLLLPLLPLPCPLLLCRRLRWFPVRSRPLVCTCLPRLRLVVC